MIIKDKNLIARGATADVYEWDAGRVAKLFNEDVPQEWIETEFAIAKNVAGAGVETPMPFEITQIDGKKTIIYERVYGVEVDEKIQQNLLRAPHYMRQMAITLADLHSKTIDIELSPLVENYTYRLEHISLLDDETKTRLIQHLQTLPAGDAVCHGDYHLKNVMISADGAVIIDWLTAVRGNPLLDVARTCIILSEDHSKEMPYFLRWLYKPVVGLLLNTFVRHYLKLTSNRWDDVAQWLPIVAAVRLGESSAQPDDLMPFIEKWLQRKVKSLKKPAQK